MADVFISYSQEHPEPTEQLAADLAARGYAYWYDTRLLPSDKFWRVIMKRITDAKAVIVIWTPPAVESDWVYGEAKLAHEQQKLICIRTEDVTPGSVPIPFNGYNVSPVGSPWSLASGDQDYGGDVYGLSFARDGRLFATSYDGHVRLYDADGTRRAKVKAPGGARPYGIAVSPDGGQIAVGYDDTTRVDVLDAATLAPRFAADTAGVTDGTLGCVAWRADGALVAGGNYQTWRRCTLMLWPTGGRGRRVALPGPASTVMDLAALPVLRAREAGTSPSAHRHPREGGDPVNSPPQSSADGAQQVRGQHASESQPPVAWVPAFAGMTAEGGQWDAGTIAFAGGDPAFGVIGGDGTLRVFVPPPMADLRAKLREHFQVSADGRRIWLGLLPFSGAPHLLDLGAVGAAGRGAVLAACPTVPAGLHPADTSSLAVEGWEDTTAPTLAVTGPSGSTPMPLALEPYEMARSLAVLPDKSGFILGAD